MSKNFAMREPTTEEASLAVAFIRDIIAEGAKRHTPAEEILRAVSSVNFVETFEVDDLHRFGLSVLNEIRSTGRYGD